jgi:AraC-like DNA-binding protein
LEFVIDHQYLTPLVKTFCEVLLFQTIDVVWIRVSRQTSGAQVNTMKSALDAISDWEHRLVQSGFRVAALARSCEISERELRRYIQDQFGVSTHAWISGKRMEMARPLLTNGKSVKLISSELQFKQQSHFSREFRRGYGASPTQFRLSSRRRKAVMADSDK